MLRIYFVTLDLIRSVNPLLRALDRLDPDLSRQCRRALSSAPLNLAEGSYSRGKNRLVRYHTALGSVREARACFETATAFRLYARCAAGYARAIPDHVIGTLVRLR